MDQEAVDEHGKTIFEQRPGLPSLTKAVVESSLRLSSRLELRYFRQDPN